MKKRRKISLKNLFYNNRFVLFFSVLCAIVLWFVMASTNTEERPMLVSDVPINIKLSDTAQANGLKVISPVDAKAKVYIKGNSLIVRAIKNTDMEVVAQLASTITAVSYTHLDVYKRQVQGNTGCRSFTADIGNPSNGNSPSNRRASAYQGVPLSARFHYYGRRNSRYYQRSYQTALSVRCKGL